MYDENGMPLMPLKQYGLLYKKVNSFASLLDQHQSEGLEEKVTNVKTAVEDLKSAVRV